MGAGLFASSSTGTLTITNSTISGNSSSALGGGIFKNTSPDATISFSTISGNSCSGVGGGIVQDNGTIFLKNSIIAGNTDSGGEGPDLYGTFSTLGGNIIGDNSGATITPNDDATDQIGTSGDRKYPKLAALADNGGPTHTMALESGSPALDKAKDCKDASNNDVTTDQRGFCPADLRLRYRGV